MIRTSNTSAGLFFSLPFFKLFSGDEFQLAEEWNDLNIKPPSELLPVLASYKSHTEGPDFIKRKDQGIIDRYTRWEAIK